MLRVHCVVPEIQSGNKPQHKTEDFCLLLVTRTPHHSNPGCDLSRVTAVIAKGKRPVPFRTRKLSPSAPMVLHWERCGRVGRRRTNIHKRAPPPPGWGSFAFLGVNPRPGGPASVGQRVVRLPAPARARTAPRRRSTRRRARSRRRPARPRRLRGGTSPRSRCASPRPLERHAEVEVLDRDGERAPGPQPHLDPLVPGVPEARWSKSSSVEVGAQLPVEHGQHVLVERRRHALPVVVRADQHVGVLDQVRAEQQPRRPGASTSRTAARNAARSSGRGCRSCRRGTPRGGGSPGVRARCSVKSATRAWTRGRGSPGDRRSTASRSAVSQTSSGTNWRSVPPARSASSSRRVFSEEPEPSSTRVWAPVRGGDLRGAALEDLALGAGRVVLLQPGDLLEELAAAGVVEPLGRQPLRGRPSGPRARRARSALGGVVGRCGRRRLRHRQVMRSSSGAVRRVHEVVSGTSVRRRPRAACGRGPRSSAVVGSHGSEATATAPRVRRVHSAWVQVVPTTARRRSAAGSAGSRAPPRRRR